jgi:hemolysin activation/secretion protein
MLHLFASVSAFAATIPDAGQLQREQQPQRQMPQQLPKPEIEKEVPHLADTGVRVEIKGFRFSGYTGLVQESDLQSVVTMFTGKTLSFGELQGVADKVTALLKGKGWFLARAYLPRQDITPGIIEIAIIQGKSDGGLIINRDKSARISDRTVRAMAAGVVSPEQPLHEPELERSVLLMNDLPGIAAKASLAQGSQPGSTAVQLDLSEGPLFSGAIWGDNYGNRYTGAWRGNGMLNLNDPFRYGDQFSLLLTGTEGLTQGRAAYSFPLAANGLKANLAYTGMRYELIGDLASLKTEGYSHSVNSGLSYPVLRSRTANITTTIGYEYKKLVDSAHDIDIRDKQLHSGVIGLNGDKYDTLLGGGLTNWNVGVTTGDMHEAVADIRSTRTEGRYTRFNFGVTRLQRVTEGLNLSLSYSGQASLDNLDSS